MAYLDLRTLLPFHPIRPTPAGILGCRSTKRENDSIQLRVRPEWNTCPTFNERESTRRGTQRTGHLVLPFLSPSEIAVRLQRKCARITSRHTEMVEAKSRRRPRGHYMLASGWRQHPLDSLSCADVGLSRGKTALDTKLDGAGWVWQQALGYRVPWRTAVGDIQHGMRRALDHSAPAVFEAHP